MYQKSSACTGDLECVEVDVNGQPEVAVRNSTNPKIVTRFTREEWRGFLAGVKAGEFDV